MSDATLLVLGALVLYVPGLLLLWACRMRSARVALAVAPVATLGLLQLAALLGAFTPLELPAATVLVTATLAVGVLVLDVRAGREGAVVGMVHQTVEAVRRAPATSIVSGVVLALAVRLGTSTWLRALGGLATPPQEHDTVTHTLLTAYIAWTGHASPFDVMPVDLATGDGVRYYPAGLHTFAALLADLGGDAVVGLNAATVLLLGLAAPVTLFAAVSTIEPARTRPVFGAVAALLSVTLYRPYLQLMHDAGILPFAVGLAMAPALAVCLLSMRRRDPRTALVTSVVAFALFAIHPSIAIIAIIVTVTVLAVCLAFLDGRTWVTERAGTLGLTALMTAIVAAPWALASVTAAGTVSGYPETPPADSVGVVSERIAGFFYGGFFDPFGEQFQSGFAVLFWIGFLGCLTTRRLWPVLAAWVSWAVAALLYGSGFADAPVLAQLGQLFFNSWVRIMSVSAFIAPAVAALGLAALTASLAGLAERRKKRTESSGQRQRPRLATALPVVVAAAVALGYVFISGLDYRETNTRALAQRYGHPEFLRITPEERAAFDFLAGEKPVGRVLNNGNDGSTFLYVYKQIPVVNTFPLGTPEARYGIYLMEHFNEIGTDPAVGCLVRRWDITHVIVSLSSPAIGAKGAPNGWVDTELFDYAPGFFDLIDVPEVELAYYNSDVAVFRIDPEVRRDSDLSACSADPADPVPGRNGG